MPLLVISVDVGRLLPAPSRDAGRGEAVPLVLALHVRHELIRGDEHEFKAVESHFVELVPAKRASELPLEFRECIVELLTHTPLDELTHKPAGQRPTDITLGSRFGPLHRWDGNRRVLLFNLALRAKELNPVLTAHERPVRVGGKYMLSPDTGC